MDERTSESAPQPIPREGRGALGLSAASLALVGGVTAVWSLYAAKSFLVPVVLALFGLVLVNGLDSVWLHVPGIGSRMTRALATTLSAIALIVVAGLATNLVVKSAMRLSEKAPEYQERLEELYAQGEELLGLERWFGTEDGADDGAADATDPAAPAEDVPDLLDRWVAKLDLTALATRTASGLAEVAGNGLLVAVYLFFLLLERRTFATKVENMFTDPERRARAGVLLARIERDVRRYVGLKVLVSLLTAVPAYAIMAWVGLDFAPVFAALIFALNFIPNLGSLIATVAPTTLALLQFPELWKVGAVAAGLTAVQLFVANIVEPPLMGRTLNMSPVVVIVSLVAWSALWGIAGAFLCVPMTAVFLIVVANIPALRWIAVLLSSDGVLEEARA